MKDTRAVYQKRYRDKLKREGRTPIPRSQKRSNEQKRLDMMLLKEKYERVIKEKQNGEK